MITGEIINKVTVWIFNRREELMTTNHHVIRKSLLKFWSDVVHEENQK